jgi:hypothetical protein
MDNPANPVYQPVESFEARQFAALGAHSFQNAIDEIGRIRHGLRCLRRRGNGGLPCFVTMAGLQPKVLKNRSLVAPQAAVVLITEHQVGRQPQGNADVLNEGLWNFRQFWEVAQVLNCF